VPYSVEGPTGLTNKGHTPRTTSQASTSASLVAVQFACGGGSQQDIFRHAAQETGHYPVDTFTNRPYCNGRSCINSVRVHGRAEASHCRRSNVKFKSLSVASVWKCGRDSRRLWVFQKAAAHCQYDHTYGSMSRNESRQQLAQICRGCTSGASKSYAGESGSLSVLCFRRKSTNSQHKKQTPRVPHQIKRGDDRGVR
jgi:hypothetical protein